MRAPRLSAVVLAILASSSGCFGAHERDPDDCELVPAPLAGSLGDHSWTFAFGQLWPFDATRSVATLYSAESSQPGRCWPVTERDRIEVHLDPREREELVVGEELRVLFLVYGEPTREWAASSGRLVIDESDADTMRGRLCARDESGPMDVSGEFVVDRCSP